MRSSNKSRSRNKKQNRRSSTNVINRVFDSSGPEGKVRGTPQQIIDKYQGLARDAQLSGDRVAAENFLQHSEHYSRLLSEANREAALRREAHEARQEQQNQHHQRNDKQPPNPPLVNPGDEQPDIVEPVAKVAEEPSSGLVETPEGKASAKRKPEQTENDQAAE